jgi:hypothetical protein
MSEEIRSLLTELAGSASMCWENIEGAGDFHSSEALRFVEDCLSKVLDLIQDCQTCSQFVKNTIKLADTWEGK